MPLKLSQPVFQKMNRLIHLEYLASLNYLSISNWFNLQQLPGISQHFRLQSEEERSHALLIVDHLLKLGMRPQVPFGGQEEGMELKRFEDASKPLECFEWSYNSEKLLLEKINELSSECLTNQHLTSHHFIQERLACQLDEFNESELLLAKAKAYSSMHGLIYHLDHELAKKNRK